MLKLEGTRIGIIEMISKNPLAKEVRIMVKPSKSIFFHLLQKTQVQKIHMTRGIFATVPKNILNALDAANVRICIIEKKAGRPPKIPHDKKMEALKKIKKLERVSKISEELKIPSSTIYAWVRRMKKPRIDIPDST